MTVVLFVISLAALERSPGYRSILLSLALGLFSLKNLILTYFYLVDDLPDIHPLMFADAVVTGAILLRLLISGTMESDEGGKESAPVAPHAGTVRSEHAVQHPTTEKPLTTSQGPPTTEEPPGV